MDFKQLVARFPEAKPCSPSNGDIVSYLVHCPCHSDGHPSLSISQKANGGIRIHCFAGCSESAILDAWDLRPIDLAPSSWDGAVSDHDPPTSAGLPSRPSRSKGEQKKRSGPYTLDYMKSWTMNSKKEKEWHYEDCWTYSTGECRLKYRYLDGSKDFLWADPVPDRPGWFYLGGVSVKNLPLYDGGTLAHLNDEEWGRVLWVVEGERDVTTMSLLHFPAVSNPGTVWSTANVAAIVAAAPSAVRVIPDNDTPGETKADATLNALTEAGIQCFRVSLAKLWPELPLHGDVTDYYNAQHKAGFDADAIAYSLTNHALSMSPYKRPIPKSSTPNPTAPDSPDQKHDTTPLGAPKLPIPYRGPEGSALVPTPLTPMTEGIFFAEKFYSYIRYCSPLGWMYFDGARWIQKDDVAAGILQRLIMAQQAYAAQWIGETAKNLVLAEAASTGLDDNKDPKVKARDAAKAEHDAAQKFSRFVLKDLMGTNKSAGILAHAAARGFVSVDELDKDGNLLVTPSGTFNLLTGDQMPNNPEFLATHCTAVSPGPEGEDMWQDFLNRLCSGDAEKVRYLQAVAGMAAFGRVLQETAILSIGPGGNGKSTFWNSLAFVLGDYSGTIKAESLTTAFRGNSDYELANLRGKRLVLAAELEPGKRMNTSMLKQLVSTDRIHARPIYRDPIDFTPTHSLVLYTNVLPSVSADDTGTWDRLAVVPLTERFRNTSEEQKDFATQLQDKCGPAILRWIIQGAMAFAADGFKLPPCQAVLDATKNYRETNDILSEFIEECCDVDRNLTVPAQELYNAYRKYCLDRNETTIRPQEFPDSMLRRGFPKGRDKRKKFYRGLALRPEEPPLPDEPPPRGQTFQTYATATETYPSAATLRGPSSLEQERLPFSDLVLDPPTMGDELPY